MRRDRAAHHISEPLKPQGFQGLCNGLLRLTQQEAEFLVGVFVHVKANIQRLIVAVE